MGSALAGDSPGQVSPQSQHQRYQHNAEHNRLGDGSAAPLASLELFDPRPNCAQQDATEHHSNDESKRSLAPGRHILIFLGR